MSVLQAEIERLFGVNVQVVSDQAVSGGCINETRSLQLSNGQWVFIKRNHRKDLFAAEARGLEMLSVSGGPTVPTPLAVFEEEDYGGLLLSHLKPAPRCADFDELLGRRLARLHQSVRNDQYGCSFDNFIGTTPQQNGFNSSWVSFFANRRLLPQVQLAQKRGLADKMMVKGVERLCDRLTGLLPEPEEGPVLLHGDLWGGNTMADHLGEPAIIDPAVYFGHREADLAMTRLFGGFSQRFYEAYNEQWPLLPDAQERTSLYNLYHLLNHLNLFGAGYAGSVSAILRRYT